MAYPDSNLLNLISSGHPIIDSYCLSGGAPFGSPQSDVYLHVNWWAPLVGLGSGSYRRNQPINTGVPGYFQ
jgi:hypothetical protein